MKLRAHSPLVEATLGAIVSALRAELPEYAKDIAIDASDLPAYANGQRFVSKGGRDRERFSAPMHFCRVFGGISVSGLVAWCISARPSSAVKRLNVCVASSCTRATVATTSAVAPYVAPADDCGSARQQKAA